MNMLFKAYTKNDTLFLFFLDCARMMERRLYAMLKRKITVLFDFLLLLPLGPATHKQYRLCDMPRRKLPFSSCNFLYFFSLGSAKYKKVSSVLCKK